MLRAHRHNGRSTDHQLRFPAVSPSEARIPICRRARAATLTDRRLLAIVALVAACLPATVLRAQGPAQLTLVSDMTLATDALLMPRTAPYGRAINGVSFQTEPFLTVNGYQYAAWYRARGTTSEDFMLARRDLASTTWDAFDTGQDLINGDSSASNGSSSWDAHNVVSIGVSGDGRIHAAWDMHNSPLKYMNSSTGVVTSPGGTWDSSILTARGSLNAGGSSITDVTYPRFITKPNGDLIMTYRTGGSGNGNMNFATYNAATGLWDAPHQIINGTNSIPYTDPVNTSFNRNAYLNGLNIGPNGDIHITWTWREEATGGSNHDIMYAYSEDGGNSWRNNAGAVVASVGSPMNLNSPGITVVTMNRTNTLMNQQAQTVDGDGGVHAIMWHKRDGLPPQTNPAFTAAPAAYFHYFRDPGTGAWTRRDLPQTRAVGSRPDVAYDANDNLYVVYVSPGPGDGVGVLDYYTEGDLVIAGATKAANYTDWTILHTDSRDFAGEPFIDQARLLESGILSVFIQEHDDVNIARIGTPLHVLEYSISFPVPLAGDYNENGVVDAADYTVWRNNLGAPAGTLPNDGDGGTIGQPQYDTWKANFGAVLPGAGSIAVQLPAVPEPSTMLLLVPAALKFWFRRQPR